MTDATRMEDSASLRGSYSPCAIYFVDSDCVEYVKRDEFCVYERMDEFLTLIFDETGFGLVGFKLKGFKNLFEKSLRPLFELHDMQFIDLASAIEVHCTQMGHKIFSPKDEKLRGAYKAALKLAANDNVKLSAHFLKKAA